MGLGGPDTPVFKDMFDYGAVGLRSAALTAADLLLRGEADVAFNLLGRFSPCHGRTRRRVFVI